MIYQPVADLTPKEEKEIRLIIFNLMECASHWRLRADRALHREYPWLVVADYYKEYMEAQREATEMMYFAYRRGIHIP